MAAEERGNGHPVVIVGGGLAGLACARELARHGVRFRLFEASDGVGGRVRTDLVDGFRLDRGFQVLLTAYSEARRQLDYQRLDLRCFEPGALIQLEGGRRTLISDPLRRPGRLAATALAPVGTLLDKLRILRFRQRVCRGRAERLLDGEQTSALRRLGENGFGREIVERFFRPFYGGVFLEPDLATSSRKLEYTFRMFATGEAAIPAAGMGAIPRQMADRLPAGSVELETPVAAVTPAGVRLASGERVAARQVVVATDGPAASRLVPALAAPRSLSVTGFYFAADRAPYEEPMLLLNGTGRGPVNHLCVPSLLAPELTPGGAHLVSVTVLAGQPAAVEGIRRQLSEWFGPQVGDWRHLATYDIDHALPARTPGEWPARRQPLAADRGVLVCGDHRDDGSIQGALRSGRLAAERLVAGAGGENG